MDICICLCYRPLLAFLPFQPSPEVTRAHRQRRQFIENKHKTTIMVSRRCRRRSRQAIPAAILRGPKRRRRRVLHRKTHKISMKDKTAAAVSRRRRQTTLNINSCHFERGDERRGKCCGKEGRKEGRGDRQTKADRRVQFVRAASISAARNFHKLHAGHTVFEDCRGANSIPKKFHQKRHRVRKGI